MKVTNNSKALQGVHTMGGLAWVPAGETRELAVSAADAAQIAKLDFMEMEGDPVSGHASVSVMPSIDIPDNEIDQLRLQIDALNSSVSDMASALSTKAETIDGLNAECARLNDLLAERDAEIATFKANSTDDAGKSDLIPAGPYEVKETSAGWFGIFGADGEQIGKNMRSKDADAFKALTPEEQAAEVAAEIAGDK
jgi:hypothetical protein